MSPATSHDSIDFVVRVTRTVQSTATYDVDGRLLGRESVVWPVTTFTEQLQQPQQLGLQPAALFYYTLTLIIYVGQFHTVLLGTN